MARRCLRIDDVVAAKEHGRGHQAHFADRMSPEDAFAHGVLIPHARYVVVGPFWRTPHKTARRGFVVALKGGQSDGVRAWPEQLRLWNNRHERRWRAGREKGAEA